MSEENVEVFKAWVDAWNRDDKRAWTNLMDPELETVPLPEWPESGPFIGPDAAWDFYKHFEEMLPAREAYEITEQIDAGDSLFTCHAQEDERNRPGPRRSTTGRREQEDRKFPRERDATTGCHQQSSLQG